MPDNRWQLLERLLDEAAALGPSERAAYLDAACPDAELRAEVESLLAAEEGAGGFFSDLGGAIAEGGAMQAALTETLVGTQIGRWHVDASLGQGGMGTVYRVTRADGVVEQTAALKLLDSIRPDVVARFAQERQILARLDHPGLARLLDGGATAEGRPYLVMEYVDGVPITNYAAAHRLGVEARVALMAEVCAAVQAAHQRLVVHRDLKPSNIFVQATGTDQSSGNDTPTRTPVARVKLLDFGIAKLLADDDAALRTQTEQRLLTPAYAAPEQLDGGAISTATDVYALGVVLYELLTGQRPFEAATPSALAVAQLQGDARRPSTVTATGSDARLAEVGLPGVQPLRRALRGDLDAICLKALRRDPNARYPSVEAFHDDLLRTLDGRPVAARDGATAYRVGRFVRRHALAVSFAVVAVLALVGGLGVALWQAQVAASEAEIAREQARRAEATVAFMTGLFESVGPEEARGRALAPADLVARGRAQIDALDTQPSVQGELLAVMGRLYQSLGLYAAADSLHTEALALRRRLLGPEHPDVAESLFDRAAALFILRDFSAADSLHRRAYALRAAQLAPEDPRLLESIVALAMSASNFYDHARADSLYTAALERWDGPTWERHPARLSALVGRATLLLDEQRPADAERLFRSALPLLTETRGADHPDVADVHYNLGEALAAQDRNLEALGAHRRALDLYRHLHGDAHDLVATSLYRLAGIEERTGGLAAAETHYQEAAAVYAETLGRDHPWSAYPLIALARLLQRENRLADALAALNEARTIYLAADLNHPDSRMATLDLQAGRVLHDLGQYREARIRLTDSRRSYRAQLADAQSDADTAAVAQAQVQLDAIEARLAALPE
ncbi:MAG: serine/threonine-protein kinase [Bacteroidota bacterium]